MVPGHGTGLVLIEPLDAPAKVVSHDKPISCRAWSLTTLPAPTAGPPTTVPLPEDGDTLVNWHQEWKLVVSLLGRSTYVSRVPNSLSIARQTVLLCHHPESQLSRVLAYQRGLSPSNPCCSNSSATSKLMHSSIISASALVRLVDTIIFLDPDLLSE